METTASMKTKAPRNHYVTEVLMTASEVAAMLRVPTKWIYNRLCSEDGLPFKAVRVGHLLRFKKSDVERFVERGGSPKSSRKK
jgi:excisionase family DNA binding protein